MSAQLWQQIIQGDGKSWVLFENGTCVILMEPDGDLEAQARALLAEWGPVHAGGPAGDFEVITLSQQPGWVVTCHHPDILTYVADGEMEEIEVGLEGRSRRDQDAASLRVVHVEDKR